MTVTQLTHATAPNWTGNEYTCCPFNADNSKILLVNRDHFILVNPDGTKLADLPIAAAQEPRWSRTDPNVLYYLTDARFGTKAQVRKYDTVQYQSTIVEELPYWTVSGRGESDICTDGDHLALCGDDKEVILYSIKNGIEAKWAQPKSFNWLKITPKKKVIIGGDEIGIIALPQRQITPYNGHSAVTSYQDRDIMLWCSSKDPALNQNAVMLFDLDKSSKPRVLLNLPRAYAFHIAVCDQPWCLVSAYDDDHMLPFQIHRVWYDGRPAELLHEYVANYRDYTSQPKAALSRDGSMAVFSVDNGSVVNAGLMKLDAAAAAPPVSVPVETVAESPFAGYKEINFDTADEGREWLWHFKVVNGKMVTRVFDKIPTDDKESK